MCSVESLIEEARKALIKNNGNAVDKLSLLFQTSHAFLARSGVAWELDSNCYTILKLWKDHSYQKVLDSGNRATLCQRDGGKEFSILGADGNWRRIEKRFALARRLMFLANPETIG